MPSTMNRPPASQHLQLWEELGMLAAGRPLATLTTMSPKPCASLVLRVLEIQIPVPMPLPASAG